MTERERWIVYPLLFLALGVALRDKLVERTTTRTVRCEELIVEEEATANEQPRVIARIGRFDSTGRVAGVSVNGVINADQYALQGNVFLPPFQVIPVPRMTPPTQRVPNQQPGTPPVQPNTAPSSPSTSKSSPDSSAPAATSTSPNE
jgi:hypothetical protein